MDEAFIQAEKLWLYGGSRPKECDPVFDVWRTHQKLTSELVRQRIELSMDENQIRLAKYLTRYLPGQERPLFDLWFEMVNRPVEIIDYDWSKIDRRMARKILSQAMRTLIQQDTLKAAEMFDKLKGRKDLSGLDLSEIEQEIALFLVLRRDPQGLARIESLPEPLKTPSLKEWHIRAALSQQNWKSVLTAWDHLDAQQKENPRWLYWKARALGASDRFEEASAIYQEIIGQQNYFSLLAADRLDQPYRISHIPLAADAEEVAKLGQEPGIQRALELFFTGHLPDARNEWIFSMEGKKPAQMRAAAIMAYEIGWHDRAILAAANAKEYDDLIVRFPVLYLEFINQFAGKNGLDPVWILALIRQESMFMADAISPAGALGAMQIMPATGRKIASLLGEPFPNTSLLLYPKNNIRFGTFYLGMRLEELQNNLVLAYAAYNAGVGRVREWLPEKSSIPSDIWVETIPFFETRNYIEKILTYNAIYRQILGLEPKRITDFMPPILSKMAFTTNNAPTRMDLNH